MTLTLRFAVGFTVIAMLVDAGKAQVTAKSNLAAPETCPVTQAPSEPFVPPAPYPTQLSRPDWFWFGSEKLWIDRPIDGVWHGLVEKVFWWRQGYDWRTENPPQLKVSGKRLDAPSSSFHKNAANPAYIKNPAMVTVIEIPTNGCWEITGSYKGDKLTFVVWVVPSSQTSECSAQDLLGVLKADDPVYHDALELARTLDAHGVPVKCVLQSKMIREFEGQKGAALYRTKCGDFEALFLPKAQTFAVRPNEERKSGRYIYSFRGSPQPTGRPWDCARPEYFVQHANQLFVTLDEPLVAALEKALAST